MFDTVGPRLNRREIFFGGNALSIIDAGVMSFQCPLPRRRTRFFLLGAESIWPNPGVSIFLGRQKPSFRHLDESFDNQFAFSRRSANATQRVVANRRTGGVRQ
jgi:hypothetical protein